MANPARMLREQAQALYPDASVVARGRSSITHRAGQQVIIDSSPGPLHIAGTETEIDTAWQPVGGAWQYEMVGADFHAFSRNQLGVGTMYRYLHPASGQYVEFQPLALNWVNDADSRQQITQPQSVMGVVSDDTITFPGGYGPGRHFAYQAQTARLRKLITIDSLAALPAATVTGTAHLEIEFILSHSAGLTWYVNGAAWDRSTRVITANQIEARDSLGNTLWMFDYPRAWDSAGNETVGQMVMRRQGANRYVTVRVPKAWVDAATFPIFLDPTINPAIAASTDDASEDGDGDVTVADFGLLVGATIATLHRYTMQRFFVTIPNNATIDASYVQWYFPGADTDDSACVIAGEDSAIPAAGSAGTDTYSISNRTKTTATVTWDADDIVGSTAGYGNSPSLNSIIQELEDSYDYSSGAYMALLMDIYGQAAAHNSSIRSYDGNSAQSPILHIVYTEGGGPTYTLAADAGSYTLTGTAAGLLARRSLGAETGSYALTGTAAGLLANRRLGAEAGSYALTGTDAGLLANRRLSAESGSYTLTGADVALLANRLLAAEAGAYTLTGIDATLVYTPVGGPTYTLVADAGSYTLTGADAGLLARRVLAAEAGSYSVSGTDAALLSNRVLAAEAGSYALTGTDAGLLVARILNAEAGSYALTGRNVTLLYSGATTPTPSARIYVINAESRAYIIVMDDRTKTVVAENRTFVINEGD